jgi:erythromycin esterase-like protein
MAQLLLDRAERVVPGRIVLWAHNAHLAAASG